MLFASHMWQKQKGGSHDDASVTPSACVNYLLPALWLQKYVIDRVLEDDGATGDQYGPYAPEHIKEERERLKKQKVRLHHTRCYVQQCVYNCIRCCAGGVHGCYTESLFVGTRQSQKGS